MILILNSLPFRRVRPIRLYTLYSRHIHHLDWLLGVRIVSVFHLPGLCSLRAWHSKSSHRLRLYNTTPIQPRIERLHLCHHSGIERKWVRGRSGVAWKQVMVGWQFSIHNRFQKCDRWRCGLDDWGKQSVWTGVSWHDFGRWLHVNFWWQGSKYRL